MLWLLAHRCVSVYVDVQCAYYVYMYVSVICVYVCMCVYACVCASAVYLQCVYVDIREVCVCDGMCTQL